MTPTTFHVADAELRILKALWDRENLSAREITDVVYPLTASADIGTVQKLLSRLEKKRMIVRDRSRHTHRFRVSVSRGVFTGRQLKAIADKLSGGSLVPLLTQLVQSGGISGAERAELRRLLDESPSAKRAGGR